VTRRERLPAALLDQLADRFKALAEPSRLAILSTLHGGELSVGALVRETGLGQANVSRHLDVLRRHGFVERRKDGLNAFYRIADREVFGICDIMCQPPRSSRPVARRQVARPEAPRTA
jgi:DNA-binding transcriptional ArsR family regulator